ncbi:MAG TPA: hypothetical protein VKX17_18135 [Planctomycetota bacterium]|nr:hypothetical protein [Planctomycetota bacterium]
MRCAKSETQIEQFGKQLQVLMQKLDKDAALNIDEKELVISQKVMDFQVHNLTIKGRWSKDTGKETGPDVDGYMFEVQISTDYDPKYEMTERHKVENFKPDFLKSAYKKPYFNLYKFRFNNDGSNVHFLFDIKIGLNDGDGKEGSVGTKACTIYNAMIKLIKENKY